MNFAFAIPFALPLAVTLVLPASAFAQRATPPRPAAARTFGFAADAIPAARVATVMSIGAIAGNVAGFGIQEVTGKLLTGGFGYAPLFYGAAVAYLLALAWIHWLVPRIVAEDEAA